MTKCAFGWPNPAPPVRIDTMSKAANVTPELLGRMLEGQQSGRTQAQIAAEVGVTRETVCRALSKHNRAVAERMARQMAAEIGCQLEQLHYMVQVAMEAWRRSCEPSVIVREVEGKPAHKITRPGAGNPALLAQVRGALSDIRDILGLDAGPVKIVVQYEDALRRVYGEPEVAPKPEQPALPRLVGGG